MSLVVGGLFTGPLVTGGLKSASQVAPDDVVSACWSVLSADAGLQSAFGRERWLWKAEAPAESALPFAVIEQIGSPDVETSWGRTKITSAVVSVLCYATTAASAASLAKSVRSTLHLAPVTVEGRVTRHVFARSGESDYLGRGPDDERMYVESADFDVSWPGAW